VPASAAGLKIVSIDVEGGAATLFVTPEGRSLLIDTGWPKGFGQMPSPDGSEESADRIVAAALEAFGRIDSLVHSAGIFWPKPLGEAPLEDFDMQWRVNVRAPYALTKAALPHLGPDSSVIFVSSIAGQVAFPNSAAYCATKGAVEQLTKALAVELSPQGIRVNCIAPGNIRTPMNEEMLKDPDYEQMYLDGTPYGRVGVVEDDDRVLAAHFTLTFRAAA